MPHNLPARKAPGGNESDVDDESVARAEEEEDEEEMEEEALQWTELTPLDELDALDDGPSTFYVGGFSRCQHLGNAIDEVQYKEDVVVLFPGLYTDARRCDAAAAATGAPLVLDEAQLGGLHILSAPLTRACIADGQYDMHPVAVQRYAVPSESRIGPWFTGLTAAAAEALLAQDVHVGNSGAAASMTVSNGKERVERNLLREAANRAVATTQPAPPLLSPSAAGSTGGAKDVHGASMTTTSGSSVFGAALTATTVNPQLYPVLSFPISFIYGDGNSSNSDESAAVGGLPHYRQQPADASDDAADRDIEDAEVEEAAESESRQNKADIEGDGEESGGNAHTGRHSGTFHACRAERAVTFAGCCAHAGVTCGPLTRTYLTQCVLGSPQPATIVRVAVTAASLSEVLIDHSIVYGGTSYGVYAYPRCGLTLQNCIVEGPNAAAVRYNTRRTANASSSTDGAAHGQGASVVDQLEQRHRRAQRLQQLRQRQEAGEDAANTSARTAAGGTTAGEARFVDLEDGVLPRFIVPPESATAATTAQTPLCGVGLMCDDADVRLSDCLLSHCRIGILLHGGCAGTALKQVDVRSCTEAGLYLYGLGGAAELVHSTVRACGRACLFLVGPSAAEVAAAAAKPTGTSAGDEEGGDKDPEDNNDSRRRPVLAQHPHLKSNIFVGVVRVQGDVRGGAVVDNYVFAPREETAATAQAATQATMLIAEDASAKRGFTFIGVEGARVAGRPADPRIVA